MSTSFSFSARSRANLEGVHPDLVRVAELALEYSEVDFTVIEGLRSLQTQRENVASGASQTMNSRHLTGHAIDVMAANVEGDPWAWEWYEKIAKAFKQASKELGIPTLWGGTWRSRDGVHFQLTWDAYPLDGQQVPSKAKATGAATAAAGAAAAATIPAAVEVADKVVDIAEKSGSITDLLGAPTWVAFFGVLAVTFAILLIRERLKQRDKDGA